MELSRDTPRQRDLDRALLAHGEPGSWRRCLVKLRQRGQSYTDMAFWLSHNVGFRIDPRSLISWTKQAERETAKAPGQEP